MTILWGILFFDDCLGSRCENNFEVSCEHSSMYGVKLERQSNQRKS